MEGDNAAKLTSTSAQEPALDAQNMRKALLRLRDEQREAVLLVGASGLFDEQLAEMTGVAVGTVKSRVNRARISLALMLGGIIVKTSGLTR